MTRPPTRPPGARRSRAGWTSSRSARTPPCELPDVKTSKQVHRLWTDGTVGQEYFLLENRQQAGYDADLPGAGLLIWHVDESKESNEDENHYLVASCRRTASRDLENNVNRGDGGDPYPGWTSNHGLHRDLHPGVDRLLRPGLARLGHRHHRRRRHDHGDGERPRDGHSARRTPGIWSSGSPPSRRGWRPWRTPSRAAGTPCSAVRQGAQGAGGGARGGSHDGHQGGHRGYREKPGEVVNAGLAAAARAARELVSEVQQQWSPRRRT